MTRSSSDKKCKLLKKLWQHFLPETKVYGTQKISHRFALKTQTKLHNDQSIIFYCRKGKWGAAVPFLQHHKITRLATSCFTQLKVLLLLICHNYTLDCGVFSPSNTVCGRSGLLPKCDLSTCLLKHTLISHENREELSVQFI